MFNNTLLVLTADEACIDAEARAFDQRGREIMGPQFHGMIWMRPVELRSWVAQDAYKRHFVDTTRRLWHITKYQDVPKMRRKVRAVFNRLQTELNKREAAFAALLAAMQAQQPSLIRKKVPASTQRPCSYDVPLVSPEATQLLEILQLIDQLVVTSDIAVVNRLVDRKEHQRLVRNWGESLYVLAQLVRRERDKLLRMIRSLHRTDPPRAAAGLSCI